MCPTASLAFRQPKGHPTPSVFHADQRGIGGFLIWTLGPELWGKDSFINLDQDLLKVVKISGQVKSTV